MKDLSDMTIKQLKYLARHKDDDAKAELTRRMRELMGEDEPQQTEEGGDDSR
jgi:hypothetical protein